MLDAETLPQGANLPEFSVSEIAAALKRTIEDSFPFVRVRGEISGLKFHSSGHVYFDLKDDKAVLNAVIWRTTARALRLKPEAGLEVICTGRISTYPGTSRYQIIVEQVELAGLGALMAMLEERKRRLAAEGLFDAARKKPLPFLPDIIGVVTSPTGAVIRDIMHRLNDRFARRVLLWPVSVQGERAASEIAAAIRGFNALPAEGACRRPHLLIVARGGGSVEDLMAFSDESVVRAAAESAIPLISAVGHETDTTLIDFAADRRAPTPTAAAEMAVPVRSELVLQVLEFHRRALRCSSRGLSDRRARLLALARVLPKAEQIFAQPRQRLDVASERLTHALRRNLHVHRARYLETCGRLQTRPIVRHVEACMARVHSLAAQITQCYRASLTTKAKHLDGYARVLETVSYRSVLDRGFVLVRGQGGEIKRRAASVAQGERLCLAFADAIVGAVVEAGAPGPASGKRPPQPQKLARNQGTLF